MRKRKPEIVDVVERGQSPRTPADPETSRVAANPLREYVGAGSNLLLASYLRALPRYIDDISRDFGDDIYDRMMQDPQVESCIEVVKLGAISQGVHLVPAKKDDTAAQEMRDFCDRALEGMDTPLVSVLYDLLDAIMFGNRLAEQVYRDGDGEDAGRLVLRTLKVKPRKSYAYVVDVWNRTVGILGLIPGVAYPVLVNAIVGDPEKIANLLPRSKFAVLTHRMKDGDPRGVSAGRPAYNPWWLKMQTWGEYLRYITQFAGPSIWGTPPEGAQRVPQTDALGNIVLDSTGAPVMLEPTTAMLEVLQQFRNGTAAAFQAGSTVQALAVGGEGAPFLQAINLFNEEISRAILGQTLATDEGQYQARAAAQVHQDVLGMVIAYVRTLVEEMVRRDILTPLVTLNFGDEARPLVPKVSLVETEQQDFAADAAAVASLTTAGYLDPSQYQELDAHLGIPPRDAAAVSRAMAAAKAKAQPPAPPAKGEKPPAKFSSDEEARWETMAKALGVTFALRPEFRGTLREGSRGLALPEPIERILR